LFDADRPKAELQAPAACAIFQRAIARPQKII
jgi:hypothetical protein